MKKLMIAMAAMAATAQLLAMPIRAELSKAQPLVVELMAPTMDEYKSSADKTAAAVVVGDRSCAFAAEAETEAAKFLLLKGAVNYYVRGEAYDKAADCIAAMQSDIGNLTPDVVVEIVEKAKSRISESKAPRLIAYYRAAKLQIRAKNEIPVLEKKLKRVKTEQLRRQYAEALAISGNWKAAYDAFAKVRDKNLAQITEAEAKGTAANERAAELWWNYKPEFEGADNFFKAHAVEFYQKALDKGEISGLKKNIVERRIAQFTEEAAAHAVAKASGASNGGDKTAAGVRTIAARIKTHTIKLNDKVSIEFVECPAGTFTMGYEKDEHSPNREHKVTITRPFWIARTKLTLEQYKAYNKGFTPRSGDFRGDFLIDGDKSPLCSTLFPRGDRRCALRRQAEDFCEYLTKKFRNAIPKGYVFRLPSDAEWEYAYTAGETNPDDFYGMSGDATKRLPMEEIEKYMITSKYIREYAAKVGTKYWGGYDETGVAVGKCKPNRWGLYDMAGNTLEMVLDTLDAKLLDAGFGPKQTALVYKDEEVDPLRYIPTNPADDGSKDSGLCRTVKLVSRGGDGGKWQRTTRFQSSFRIAVGPDLIAEKKAGKTVENPVPAVAPPVVREEQRATPSTAAVKPAASSVRVSNGKEISVQLKTGVMMDFVPCPAGTFEMGVSEDAQSAKFKHAVTITRPFWIGKYQVTKGQWQVFEVSDLDDCDRALGGMEKAKHKVKYADAMAYCNLLMKKYKRYLPKGYVYRLPTEAEWEYALHANCSDENDPYVQVFLHPKDVEAWKKIAVENEDIKQMAQNNGFPVARLPQFDGILPPIKVGTKLPNSWGVYDMLGNGVELLLDMVQIDNFTKRWSRNEHINLHGLIKYKAEEVDPLRMVSGTAWCPCCLVRTKSKTSLREPLFDKMVNDIYKGAQTYNTFRVVIGPDLLKERGIKQPKLGK